MNLSEKKNNFFNKSYIRFIKNIKIKINNNYLSKFIQYYCQKIRQWDLMGK